MQKHVTALGVFYIAFASLGVLLATGVIFLINFLRVAGAGEVLAPARSVLLAVALFMALLSAPGIIGGVGLLKRLPWARILVLVLGFLNLVFVPFGTLLGVYTVWVLLKDETVRMFEAAPDLPVAAEGRAMAARHRDYRLPGLVWIAAGVAFAICAALAVGLTRGAERALTVGIWGVIPLAVGVAFLLYGMTVRREQAGPTDAPGGGRRMGGLGVLCVVALSLLASSAWAYTHEEVFQKTVPASGIAKLSVTNLKGEISVEPWDRPEIQIEAKKVVGHSHKEGAEEHARKIEIAVETKENTVEVRTIMPEQKDEWDWVEGFFSLDWLFEGFVKQRYVSYTISAPQRMDVDLNGTNSALKIGAMEGRVDLQATNGSVTAEGTRGYVQAKTTNGRITLSRLEGGSEATATNGRITAEFLALGSRGCRLRTTNGSIRVALPESLRADLNASTANGRITCDLPISLLGESSRRRTEGKINGGGPPLELRTTNGNIAIVKYEGKAVAGVPAPDLPPRPERPGLRPNPDAGKGIANFLRIQVWEDGEQKVKVTVPLSLAREALRSLPDDARDEIREKGIDIDKLVGDILYNPKPGRVVEIQDEDSRVEIELIVQ